MKEPMDWEAAFTETQEWTKKAAERSRRLLSAVAEMRDNHICLSRQIDALTKMAAQIERTQTQSLSKKQAPALPAKPAQWSLRVRDSLLGFALGVLVVFLLT